MYRVQFRQPLAEGIDDAQSRDNRFYGYKDGSALPEYDFNRENLCSALNVGELLVPGSLKWLFLPLFNLLDGPLKSPATVRDKNRTGSGPRLIALFNALGLTPLSPDKVIAYGRAKRNLNDLLRWMRIRR